MLRTRVYAGPVTNLTDARYFSSFGVDWLGFCFDPARPEFIEPSTAAEIRGWLHGVACVGEFAGTDADNAAGMAGFLNLDAALVPVEDLALAQAALPDLPLLVTVRPDTPNFALAALPQRTAAVIADLQGTPSGERDAVLARLAEALPPDAALVADLELPAPALPAWLEAHPGLGLRLRGGAEQQVGVKLFAQLDAYMQALEVED
jgi:phosphoribosylanthranilate isomerase